jgi:hypothetical protein
MTPGQQKQIWDSMLDADLSARYWRDLIKYDRRYDLGLRFAILCFSSAAVADWMGWLNIEWLSKTWPVLAIGSGVASSVLDFSGRIEKMTELVGKWTALMHSYENLLNAPPTSSDSVISQLRDLQERHTELTQAESRLPNSKRSVKKRASREVCESRGLLKPSEV